jgi:hypothetical protein
MMEVYTTVFGRSGGGMKGLLPPANTDEQGVCGKRWRSGRRF